MELLLTHSKGIALAQLKRVKIMKTVAKIFFNAESDRNLDDNLWEVVLENDWNDFGSIKMESLENAVKAAKEIAEKNEVTAYVEIYGTMANGRFNPKN